MMNTPRQAIKRMLLSTAIGFCAIAMGSAQLDAQTASPRGPATKAAHTQPHSSGTAQAHFIPEVITAAGGGGYDSGDGIPATNAYLRDPHGVVIDSAGNVYLVDSGDGVVRRISASDGTITTVVGVASNGGGEVVHKKGLRPHDQPVPGTQVTLDSPNGIALGPDGALYIADTYDQVIYKMDTQGLVTLVAGTVGYAGYSADGTAAAGGQLSYPGGVAVDASGNVYIADSGNNVVRRVNASDGTMTTVAGVQGGGGYGGDGAAALNALLNYPLAVAFDANGGLLIADTYNDIVRRVDAVTGLITTVAGTPQQSGFAGDGGAATAAALNAPWALAVDNAGQVYIADQNNDVVRKVGLDGNIMTVAGLYSANSFFGSYSGDGAAATATVIGNVKGVAIDANGELYVSSSSFGLVLKLGPGGIVDFQQQQQGTTVTKTLLVENTGNADLHFNGSVFTLSGNGFAVAAAASNGCSVSTPLVPGAVCGLSVTFSPSAVAAYNATLTLNDDAPGAVETASLTGSGVLPVTDTALTLSTQSASTGDAVTFTATVVPDSGTGPTPTGSVLFVDTNSGNTLAQANLNSSGSASVTTTSLAAGSYFVVAQYQGSTAYAASSGGGTDLEVTARVATVTLTSSASTANTGDSFALSATVMASGNAPAGTVEFRIDGVAVGLGMLVSGGASATVTAPNPGAHSLQAVYSGDTIYGVAYSNVLTLTTHGAVLQFTPGSAVTLAGTPSDDLHGGFGGDGGPAASAYLHTPYGVSTDAAGNVYIADEENNVIRKVSVNGTISTVAGVPYSASIYNTVFSGDGDPATSAYLDHPTSVVVDGAGNLYIADYSNNVVREVTAATGTINTIAGNHYNGGTYNGDGAGTSTLFYHPSALALDAAGNLFIADTGNNLVRRLDTSGNVTTVAGNYYSSHNGPAASGVPATSAALYNPGGVVADKAGNLYISDTSYNLIRKVDTNGTITTIAGGGAYAAAADNVPALNASLNLPQQLTIDLVGDLYFAEAGNSVIRKIDTSGILTTPVGFLGSSLSPWSHFDPQGEPSNLFQLQSPSGVAVASDGSVLAVDTYNQTVIRSGPAGAALFGPEAIGQTSDAQNIVVSNVGDAPLVFGPTPYTVTGDYTVSAGATNNCNFTAPMPPGKHCNISVAYANQGGGQSGTVLFSANVQGTPTLLLKTNTSSVSSATTLYMPGATAFFGDNLLFLAVVSVQGPPAPGSVSFFDGSTLMGNAVISNGYASLYYAGLAKGTHTITAQYLGNGYYAGSVSSAQTIVITGPATATSLSVSGTAIGLGSPLTMTSAVTTANGSVIAEGSITFYDGSSALGTRPVNSSGVATLTVSNLGAGTHSITAAYQTNNDYAGSTSADEDVTVSSSGGGGDTTGLEYIIQVDGLPVTIRRGQTATVGLDYIPLNNYAGTVTLSCGTLPSYASCSFSPTSVNLASAQQQSVTLTITTTPLTSAGGARDIAVRMGGKQVAVIRP